MATDVSVPARRVVAVLARSLLAVALPCSIATAAQPVKTTTQTRPEPRSAPVREPAGDLTLRDALDVARARSPQLAPHAFEVAARRARIEQAGVLPNPEARLDVENVGGSGDRESFETTESTLRFSQLIELGGKRRARVEVAEVGVDLARFDLASARRALDSSVRKAFVDTLAAQERVALARELERLASETSTAVDTQVRAGAAPPVDVVRAHVAVATVRAERARAETDLTAARGGLAALWGSRTPRFAKAVGDLHALAPLPARERLLARARQSPDVARWDTEIEERSASLALERARGVIDVTVGAGGRHFSDNGDNALVVELTVPLPVFDRNQGAIEEARLRIDKARAERDAARASAAAALSYAYDRLVAAREQAIGLRDHALPEANAAVEGALRAHRQGLFRYAEVLDARRALYELRSTYIAALEDFHDAAVEIERLSGGPLEPARSGGRS